MSLEKKIPIIVLSIILFSYGVVIPTSEAYAESQQVIFSDGSGIPGCETTNSCYSPFAVSIGLGETVTWGNTDTAAHTATSGVSGYFGEEEPLGPDGEFDSGLLMVGNSFSHTFNKEGIYNYFCMVHPWMTGIIIVDENYSLEPKYVDIQLFTDKKSYLDGDTISIFGTISNKIDVMSITLAVIDPVGEVIAIEQFDDISQDDKFNTIIMTGGQLWQYDGTYTIRVVYGSNQAITTIQYQTGSFSIAVWADKDIYYSGDTVTLSGYVQPVTDDTITIQIRKVDYNEFPTVLSFTKKPNMNGEYKVTFSTTDLKDQGNYNVKVIYGNNSLDAQTAFEFKTITVKDNVPPLILTPSNISVETANQYGIVVTYSVKAIDDVDGVVNVSCGPFSGTTFPLGETLVICSTMDDAGNSATKSFVVTVKNSESSIPDWVKNVAEFWCNDEIDDASFVEAIQYLIENNVIQVPLSYDSSMNVDQTIPNWIKNNACWWSQGLISDDEFASGLEYLIEQGIVTV